MSRIRDITGMRFGRLIAIEHSGFNTSRNATWLCRCDCGKTSIVNSSALIRGLTHSCGCGEIEARKIPKKHGFYTNGKKQPELAAYYEMKRRCTNPRTKSYRYYGGRGIEFKFESFLQFFAEVGPRPSPKHTIDRIQNEGHYAPGNVRWATHREQALNSRLRRRLTIKQVREIRRLGKAGLPQTAIASEFNVNRGTVRDILNGKNWTHI